MTNYNKTVLLKALGLSILIHAGVIFLIPSPAPKQGTQVQVSVQTQTSKDNRKILRTARSSTIPTSLKNEPLALDSQLSQAPSTSIADQTAESSSTSLSRIRDQINATLDYPMSLRRKGIQGKVEVRLALNSKGEIETLEVTQSSGFEQLDQLATQAIHRASPFKNLTKEEKMGRLIINLPIQFILNK